MKSEIVDDFSDRLMRKINLNQLICPDCLHQGIFYRDHAYFCANTACVHNLTPFLSVDHKPVLINFKQSLVKPDVFSNQKGTSVVARTESTGAKWVRGLIRGKNKITGRNINKLMGILAGSEPRILIVGGGEVGSGLQEFYTVYGKDIVSFDVYNSAEVDFIADGHQIPVAGEYFDLVIVQAVLEHVLNPHIVVSEITRVLKTGGVVYAETPFMQQVHEGPFDFTRFTESGHRYLFRNYEMISSGYSSGAGNGLLWSLDFFFSGLFRSRKVGKLVRVLFFWLRFFDNAIPAAYNIDAACGVFFMGRKQNQPIVDTYMITHYQGAQKN